MWLSRMMETVGDLDLGMKEDSWKDGGKYRMYFSFAVDKWYEISWASVCYLRYHTERYTSFVLHKILVDVGKPGSKRFHSIPCTWFHVNTLGWSIPLCNTATGKKIDFLSRGLYIIRLLEIQFSIGRFKPLADHYMEEGRSMRERNIPWEDGMWAWYCKALFWKANKLQISSGLSRRKRDKSTIGR